MPLELHSNDCAREARPGLWIFSGRSVVFLVIGVAIFVALFRIMAAASVDWYFALPLSLIPLGVISVFVHLLVNGRPTSFASDLILFAVWRFKTWLYLAGALDRPPVLWIQSRNPTHPSKF
jgi:hypothetical protein